MKRKLLVLFTILYTCANAQAPDWQWAKKISGAYQEIITNTAMDAKNNLLVFGNFNTPAITFDNITLTRKYPQDYFLAKYNSNGKVLWAKRPIDAPDGVAAVKIDTITNNMYILGGFKNQLIIGTDTLRNKGNNTVMNSFIAKTDSLGNPIWARSILNAQPFANLPTVDEKGNLYVTGNFAGTTAFVVNNDTIKKSLNQNINYLFILKLSPAGNLLWSKVTGLSGYLMPNSIATSKGVVYVAGSFSQDTLFFDKDTVFSNGSTASDAFLVKHDSLGNELWAKSISGDSEEDQPRISVNKTGDLYFTQYTYSPEIRLNGVSTPMFQGATFIAKLTPSGNTIWTKTLEPLGGDIIYVNDHVSDQSNNLYLAGSFSCQRFAFAGDTLKNNPGKNQLFILKYDATGTPSWILGASTLGDQTASVAALNVDKSDNLYASGNFSSSSLKLGKSNFVNSGVNTFESFVTKLSRCSAPVASICMVSVDSLSQNNVIVWDKASYTNVDSFIVYREIGTNDFRPIAHIPYSAPGEFVDTVRSLYFPNTGNPNAGTYRYKIQALDTCANYSTLSPYHNTIFITSNNGNFTWAQLYNIENGSNPVSSYVLMRDDLSNNKWHAVASVAGTQQNITDPDFAAWVNTARWRIETIWNISCKIYHKDAAVDQTVNTTYTASRSNILKFKTTGIDGLNDGSSIAVFPNPTKGIFSIEAVEFISEIEINNTLGEVVYKKEIHAHSEKIDLTNQPAGMYYIHVLTKNGISVKKLIFE